MSRVLLVAVLMVANLVTTGIAQESAPEDQSADLALALQNPLASVSTLPIQMNFDQGIGLDGEGSIWQMNIQPVLPMALNEDWYLISRTIIPIIGLNNVPDGNNEFGTGDTLQSLFLSPVKASERGWIRGLLFIHKFFQPLVRRSSNLWRSQSSFGFLPTRVGGREVIRSCDCCSRQAASTRT